MHALEKNNPQPKGRVSQWSDKNELSGITVVSSKKPWEQKMLNIKFSASYKFHVIRQYVLFTSYIVNSTILRPPSLKSVAMLFLWIFFEYLPYKLSLLKPCWLKFMLMIDGFISCDINLRFSRLVLQNQGK